MHQQANRPPAPPSEEAGRCGSSSSGREGWASPSAVRGSECRRVSALPPSSCCGPTPPSPIVDDDHAALHPGTHPEQSR
ncbi:hypothetical protein HPB50_026929 [Hyalomma asiaticum]|uniref:Uncharacterized protein n=1 Tax=Hyalomma asiaticum TaxID=266040 RepID=A0ACB7T9L0_HYAAI|nr:hypothetical protein HPB50_026929 [Hyalomma asiaticum]